MNGSKSNGRRDFLRLAGCACAALGPLPPQARPRPQPAPAPPVAPFDVEEATLGALQEKMRAGALRSRALTESYLRRIEELDRRGPALRSVIETNPDALAIAESLDQERKAKGARGPLHGIPVLVKDNIDTADRMTTTAGSLALEGSIASRDAFVVERLRAAGAVILGKTNLSRVGQLPLDPLDLGLERARRPVPEPLRPRPQPLRVELRLGSGGLRQPLRSGRRHRDRRLHRLPVHDQRDRGDQAHPRAREPGRHRPHRPQPGHGGTDGPHGAPTRPRCSPP